MNNLPETIYLIKVDAHEWAWCECPSPLQGMDAPDPVRYIKLPISPARGEPMPRTIEHYQANALRDQELILEMKGEISALKHKNNQLTQKLSANSEGESK